MGHAINRGVEKPNLVFVYLQAEKLEQLRGFVSSPKLKAAMQEAGVQGPPQMSFVQGQEWGD